MPSGSEACGRLESYRRSIVPESLNGKTCLITGANTGIGLAAAIELARRGATVVMACRNPERGEGALKAVQAAAPGAKAELLALDLASLGSVREAAREFGRRHAALHVLINNAGLWAPSRQTTRDGFEMTFAVNHLGHFLLTRLLVEKLAAGAPSRIVNVSSAAHKGGRIDWDDIHAERSYGGWGAYSNSKLANVLFTRELARRLPAGVTANAVHPGVINTEIFRHLPGFLKTIGGLFLATAETGAQPLLRLACDEDLAAANGRYFNRLTEEKPSSAALDDEAAVRLWTLSERLVGA